MKTLELESLDLAESAERGFELQLLDPRSGEPLPMWLQLLGTDSRVYREKVHQMLNERREAAANGKTQPLTLQELDAQAAQLLAAVTTGWRGDFTFNGQSPAFSEAAAVQLYTRFAWMRLQVDAATSNRANFMHRSATSSPPSPSTNSD